ARKKCALASTHASEFPMSTAGSMELPALKKTGRGAHIAINSWESTGRSLHLSGPAYFKKLPAIQWYSLWDATFSTSSPQSRRGSFAPPSPEELTKTTAMRGL